MARRSSSTENSAADSSASYEGLARRYRPQTFEDVVGQRHVVATLVKAVEQRRWAAAYLLVGGRGLGKTTMARLLAKAVNCENGPTAKPCCSCAACVDIAAGRDIDVLEIDAASNTGVDHVRDTIIQAVSTSPARGRARIFIIDEVHMLSAPAFNALLKTVEEPPPNVLFILATTDAHKVPPTIRSRCQRFDFRPLSIEELSGRLKMITSREKIAIDDEALRLICDYAEGGVRDSLSALDLIRSFASDKITLAAAEEALGVIPSAAIARLVHLIASGDSSALASELTAIMDAGGDNGEVMRGLLNAFRKLLIDDVEGRTGNYSRARIIRSLEAILESAERSRQGRHARLELELLLCRLAEFRREEISILELYDRLVELETSAPRDHMAPTSGGVAAVPKSAEIEHVTIAKSANASASTSTSSRSAAISPGSGAEKSSIAPPLAGTFSAAAFLSRLAGVSTLVSTLLEGAKMTLTEQDELIVILDKSFAYDRFQKDQALQVTVAKALESHLGRRARIRWELAAQDETGVEAARSVPAEKPESTKSAVEKAAPEKTKKQKLDPKLESEIDRIKKIFGAEVVEIIE